MAAPIRVLLVEDNDVYRQSLELLLGMREDVRVVASASDGSAAAEACAAAGADVVLMDFRLPGVDGAQATAAVLERCPGVGVVCLTAEATEEEEAAVHAAGAAALVRKGGPIEELAGAIASAAGRGA